MTLASRLRLYLVADLTERQPDEVLAACRAGLAGGVTAIQHRDKGAPERGQARRQAARLGELARTAGALYVVNDDLDLALEVGADAVHLGPHDLPLEAARERAGPSLLIGASAGTPERARQLEAEGASYLGVGAIFEARPTKPDASAPRGLDGLARVVAAVRIPVVAIGGLRPHNAAPAVAAGAAGVAVVRAILEAGDPEAAARELRAQVERGLAARASSG